LGLEFAVNARQDGVGTLALLGSGETSSQGRKIHDYLMGQLGVVPVRVAMVETPAGFQPNVHTVYAKVGEFLEKSLQNYRPQVEYVPAHKKYTANDPDSSDIAGKIAEAQYVFSGPGSPTYAAQHLSGTRTLHMMASAYRSGATLALSSAAAIAVGSHVLCVYEIFKAGSDLAWNEGLHLLPMLGMGVDPAIVTHWNNAEGGAGLDTTRCYMGRDRFDRLVEMLPVGVPVLGIDEHTACIFEAGGDTVKVMGAGTATVLLDGQETVIASGQSFPLALLESRLVGRA
jgi:cyanophycinase-like exopeptidase